MQLMLRRSQREGGLVGKTAIFCLDARVEFAAEERRSISKYKLHNEIVYSSAAQQNAAAGSVASAASATAQRVQFGNVDDFLSSATAKVGHGLKAAALGAVSAMRLRISIASLERGQHVECKDLLELMGAMDAIMTACQNVRAYLELAASFDGSQTIYEFENDGTPRAIAGSAAPAAELVAPQPALALAPPNDLDRRLTDYAVEEEFAAPGYNANPFSSYLQSGADPLDTVKRYLEDPTVRLRIVWVAIALVLLILISRAF